MTRIEERVYAVMSTLFHVPADRLEPHLSPETLDGWDSLKHLNLTLALEEEFGVQFTVDEMSAIQTDVATIVAVVGAHIDPPGDRSGDRSRDRSHDS